MSARASVLVLSHDRPALLRRSVASVLAQTVAEIEVLIVGDGVTDAVREAASALSEDSRVRLLDNPKGEHHGEVHRDAAIRAASSNAIFYLCDDDLLMPSHVESLLALLETRSFVQSRNCWIDEDGAVLPYPTDLASEASVALHRREDLQHNAVSITGTAHRRDFYLAADSPWMTTPAGRWPDHVQWQRLMQHPQFSGATSGRATALQFPNGGSLRESWTEQQRADELDRWLAVSQHEVDALLDAGTQRYAEQLGFDLRVSARRISQLEAQLSALEATRSWRWTAPLRRLRRRG